MATYTDFTSQARHMICYSFVCQHCGENSGPIYHEFQGVAKKRKSGVVKYLKDDEKEILDRNARRELELNINEAKQQVSENVYSHLYFNGKCPIALPRTLLAKKQPAPSVVRPTTTKRLHDTEVWPSPIASFHPCLNPKDKSNI